jgi:hypothetical protein
MTLQELEINAIFKATSPENTIQFQGKKLDETTVLITHQAGCYTPPEGAEMQLVQIQEACDTSGFTVFQDKA